MSFFVHLLVLSLAVLGVSCNRATASVATGLQGPSVRATASGFHSPPWSVPTGLQGPSIRGCGTDKFSIEGVKPTVYMRDIENTIAYALRNQAPYTIHGAILANGRDYKTLTEPELGSLSTFTRALVNHLPLRTPLEGFLKCLSCRLLKIKSIPGRDLEGIYRECGSDRGGLPKVLEWVGCQNFKGNPKQKQFRSYPCGVWTTFHAMTVNLVQSTPQEVSSLLPTLYGLVNYFPWCNMCKTDFRNMYNADKGSLMTKKGKDMKTAEEVTMWLWEGHNIVTKRVAGQGTDQGGSNLQFPHIDQCRGCCRRCSPVTNECATFNRTEVYSYVQMIYSPPFQ